MMKCISTFYDRSIKAIKESSNEAKVTWALIATKLKTQFYELSQLKFESPTQPKDELLRVFKNLNDEIDKCFREIQ